MSSQLRDPILISLAPNGARYTKRDNSFIPLNHDEIVDETVACYELGVRMVHLHVRNDNGQHVLDANKYRRLIDSINDRIGDPSLVLQITTEAQGIFAIDDQIKVVTTVKPASFSIAIRELFPDLTTNSKQRANYFIQQCLLDNIAPQYIFFSPDEVTTFLKLQGEGVLPKREASFLFVLGKYNQQDGRPNDLIPFYNIIHEKFNDQLVHWSVCAFGQYQYHCLIQAALLGGHIRVGFENYMNTLDGQLAKSNACLVKELINGIKTYGIQALGQETDVKKILTVTQ